GADGILAGAGRRVSAEDLSRAGAGFFAIAHHGDAVDQDVPNAFGKMMRGGEGGGIPHSFRIENYEVGGETFLHLAAFENAEGGGGEGSHAADGFLEAEDFFFLHI